MGIFVIIAAILNKVYSTLPALLNDSVNYTFWYMREATVSVYVINLPTLWPVLRHYFPIVTGRGSSAGNSRGNTSNVKPSRSWLAIHKRTHISSNVKDDAFEMNSKRNDEDLDSEGGSNRGMSKTYFNTSQEHIIESGLGNDKSEFSSERGHLEIKHDVTFKIEHSSDTDLPTGGAMSDWKSKKGYHANVEVGNNRND